MNRPPAELGRYNVTDDSGFLALVDPDAYEGFVGRDWDFVQLVERFRDQMAKRRLLIWGTGMENTWSVEVRSSKSQEEGFRSTTGSIRCTQGRLLLTSYDSLSRAAQFADTVLPERHERDQTLQVELGMYGCRIIQLRDPENYDAEQADYDFSVELERNETVEPEWTDIPWRSS